MDFILELEHLRKYFSAQKAIEDVSFNLPSGTMLGLIGPNGAGKTTLLRMITGIFLPDSGRILIKGRPFKPYKDIRFMGYMPEERGLYKKMKIFDQLIYLSMLKGLSRKEAVDRLNSWFYRLGMLSWKDKRVEDLSKGMAQKLQFVSTVLHDPELIILDEPFSGLDPVNAELLQQEILRLKNEGKSIIFSTHLMSQAESLCEEIVLINKGMKILDGTVSDIKQKYFRGLYHLKLDTPYTLEETSLFEVVASSQDDLMLRLSPEATGNDLLRYFIDRQVSVRLFEKHLPSLNDIFISLVDEKQSITRIFDQKGSI